MARTGYPYSNIWAHAVFDITPLCQGLRRLAQALLYMWATVFAYVGGLVRVTSRTKKSRVHLVMDHGSCSFAVGVKPPVLRLFALCPTEQ